MSDFIANEIREMRNQLVDCFPHDADVIRSMSPRLVVEACERHLRSIREWAEGDIENADMIHAALVDIAA